MVHVNDESLDKSTTLFSSASKRIQKQEQDKTILCFKQDF